MELPYFIYLHSTFNSVNNHSTNFCLHYDFSNSYIQIYLWYLFLYFIDINFDFSIFIRLSSSLWFSLFSYEFSNKVSNLQNIKTVKILSLIEYLMHSFQSFNDLLTLLRLQTSISHWIFNRKLYLCFSSFIFISLTSFITISKFK